MLYSSGHSAFSIHEGKNMKFAHLYTFLPFVIFVDRNM